MRILFATPYRATTHPDLLRQAGELRDAALHLAWMRGYTVDVGLYADSSPRQRGLPSFTLNAQARNALLETFLTPEHEAVFWVDADLIRYPSDIIMQLDQVREGGVAAPFVYLDHSERLGGKSQRFYDTMGFIEALAPARPYAPHFSQAGPVVRLRSVGCCYLIPAQVYHAGGRYVATPPYCEHWSIMRAAEALGYPIVADSRIEAWHAYLPDYGEKWHSGQE